MTDQTVTKSNNDWAQQIKELELLLTELRPKLVEAESELADHLAAINAFEFKLRSRLAAFLTKIEELDKQIQALRRKQQWLGDQWEAQEEDWEIGNSATEDGDYRYRSKPARDRKQDLTEAEADEIKKLYRDLARRFHPDMAASEEDREYRTQIMMAINAAYAAGDLKRLKEIALEPDSIHGIDFSTNEQLLAEALQREHARILRRLKEINQEMNRLNRHATSKMMRQAADLAAKGRDFFIEKEDELKDQIAYKKVEMDSLKAQIDSFESGAAFSGENFAEAVWEVSLEQSLDDTDLPPNFDRYIQKRQDKIYFEEDFDDDMDMD